MAGSSVKPSNAAHDNLIDEIIKLWQPRLKRELSLLAAVDGGAHGHHNRIEIAAVRVALAQHAAGAAIALLGEPNVLLSSKPELRFGSRGSLAVVMASTIGGVLQSTSDRSLLQCAPSFRRALRPKRLGRDAR